MQMRRQMMRQETRIKLLMLTMRQKKITNKLVANTQYCRLSGIGNGRLAS